MLTYKKSDQLQVISYSDSVFSDPGFDGCPDNRKSIFGFGFMMEGEAISWKRVN